MNWRKACIHLAERGAGAQVLEDVAYPFSSHFDECDGSALK